MLINSYVSYALSVLGRSERTVTEYAKEIRAFARWLAPDLDASESLVCDCLQIIAGINLKLESGKSVVFAPVLMTYSPAPRDVAFSRMLPVIVANIGSKLASTK